MPTLKSPWLWWPRPNPRARLRLFCFPYAGGSASTFRDWPRGIPDDVELCAIQPPGRGHRLSEPPFVDLRLLVQASIEAIQPLCEKPFAVFGHSMGAKLGFEFTRQLRQQSIQPVHLFLSGCRAPQIAEPKPFYDLPHPKFMEKLRELKGTPAELLDDPEMMAIMVPLMRADFEALQTHVFAVEPPLDCPLTVFGGLQDDGISRDHLEGWQRHTNSRFSLQMFPGDHFYFRKSESLLLAAISEMLITYHTPGQ